MTADPVGSIVPAEVSTKMMPGRQPRAEFAQAHEAAARAPQAAPAPGQIASAAWIFTPDGRLVTGGTATVRTSNDDWHATLASLDRPGMVATLYFAEGLREVALQLQDGRSARARITSTTFLASAERVCELAGLEPLA